MSKEDVDKQRRMMYPASPDEQEDDVVAMSPRPIDAPDFGRLSFTTDDFDPAVLNELLRDVLNVEPSDVAKSLPSENVPMEEIPPGTLLWHNSAPDTAPPYEQRTGAQLMHTGPTRSLDTVTNASMLVPQLPGSSKAGDAEAAATRKARESAYRGAVHKLMASSGSGKVAKASSSGNARGKGRPAQQKTSLFNALGRFMQQKMQENPNLSAAVSTTPALRPLDATLRDIEKEVPGLGVAKARNLLDKYPVDYTIDAASEGTEAERQMHVMQVDDIPFALPPPPPPPPQAAAALAKEEPGAGGGGDASASNLRVAPAYKRKLMAKEAKFRGASESPEAISVLRAWLLEHWDNPFPSPKDKEMLARKTGLQVQQVANWYINERTRTWKPLNLKLADKLDAEEAAEAGRAAALAAAAKAAAASESPL